MHENHEIAQRAALFNGMGAIAKAQSKEEAVGVVYDTLLYLESAYGRELHENAQKQVESEEYRAKQMWKGMDDHPLNRYATALDKFLAFCEHSEFCESGDTDFEEALKETQDRLEDAKGAFEHLRENNEAVMEKQHQQTPIDWLADSEHIAGETLKEYEEDE